MQYNVKSSETTAQTVSAPLVLCHMYFTQKGQPFPRRQFYSRNRMIFEERTDIRRGAITGLGLTLISTYVSYLTQRMNA